MAMVTVIVPMYNVEKYICNCLDSIVNQTYKNLQIVIVDDGSPDKSGEIADKYASQDSRITVIHKKNQGLGLARNSGLEFAEGKYTIFVDSDDWLDLDHIESLVKVAEEKNVDVVIHSFKTCDSKGNRVKDYIIKTGVFENVIDELLMPMLASSDSNAQDKTLPIGAWCKLYKTEIIKNNKLRFINEKEFIAEDIFFNIDYLSCCQNGVAIEEYGYNYRKNENSISNAYNKQRSQRTFLFYEKLKERINQEHRFDSSKEHRVERCYIGKCRAAIRIIEASSLSRKEKLLEIGRIIHHPSLIEALNEFPIRNYSRSLYLIAVAMKLKNALLVYHLFKIRRMMKDMKEK